MTQANTETVTETATATTEEKSAKKAKKAKTSAPKAPKEPKPKKPKVGKYPFETKREILAKVQEDDSYVLQSLQLLHQFQTPSEQESKKSASRNRRGFMSSHVLTGTRLAEKSLSSEGLSSEELSQAREIVSHYGRQLAAFSREQRIAENPELAKVAKVFSAA